MPKKPQTDFLFIKSISLLTFIWSLIACIVLFDKPNTNSRSKKKNIYEAFVNIADSILHNETDQQLMDRLVIQADISSTDFKLFPITTTHILSIANDSLRIQILSEIFRDSSLRKFAKTFGNLSFMYNSKADNPIFINKSLSYVSTLDSLSCLYGLIQPFSGYTVKNLNDSTITENQTYFLQQLVSKGITAIDVTTPHHAKFSALSSLRLLKQELKYEGFVYVNPLTYNPTHILLYLQSGIDKFVSENKDSLKFALNYLLNTQKIDRNFLLDRTSKICAAECWSKSLKIKNVKLNQIDSLVLVRTILKNAVICILPENKNTIIDNIDSDYKFLNFSNHSMESIQSQLKYFFKKSDWKTFKKYSSDIIIKNISKSSKNILIFGETIPENLEAVLKNYSKNIIAIIHIGNINQLQPLSYPLIQLSGGTSYEIEIAGNLLIGAEKISGKIPWDLPLGLKFGAGKTTELQRISFAIPDDMGIDSHTLTRIDTLARMGISVGAYPGCQILVIKQGKIVYLKSFGNHTYGSNSVAWDDLYDIASVTKVAAATLYCMKMVDNNKIKLSDPLSKCYQNTQIEYTRIEPDTIIKADTVNFLRIVDKTKFLKNWDTIRINDSMVIATDTILVRLTPENNIFKVTFNELLRHESGVMPTIPILPYLYYKSSKNRAKFRLKAKSIMKQGDDMLNLGNIANKTDITKKSKEDSVVVVQPIKLSDMEEALFLRYFSRKYSDSSKIQIAERIYLKQAYVDTLWLETKQLQVMNNKIYKYSDVSMILLQMSLDSLNRTNAQTYLSENFYRPLGMHLTTFQPMKYLNRNKIVPTENDMVWRGQLVHGYVHDPSAAMLGGISGNAGLFSNALELGILFQMLQNKGKYGGRRYLGENTVNLFTARQSDSFRALGFDMQGASKFMAKDAGNRTYGHTGFTGTCVWSDPDNEIVYVFLSNRVYPTAKNWTLNNYNFRGLIHQVVYDAMKVYKEKHKK